MGVDYDGNGVGEPVPTWKKPGVAAPGAIAVPPTSDEFDADRLGLPWQWHANHEDSWCASDARIGWLRLFARPLPGLDLGRAPHFLGQKYPARAFAVETLLDFSGGRPGDFAGLAIVGGRENAALGVRRTAVGSELVFLLNQALQRIGALDTPVVRLRVAVAPDGGCTFGFAPASGAFTTLPQPFRASEGGWIGAKAGLIAIATEAGDPAGHADFDYFRFSA